MTTVLCALLGAIIWNLVTWWMGLPSSSSHALIGGLVRRSDRFGGRRFVRSEVGYRSTAESYRADVFRRL